MPSEARTAPPKGSPIALDVVVERHPLAELAADQRLARDREGDLAGTGLQKQPVRSEIIVPARDAVDVALVDDAAVGVEEVESDRWRREPRDRAARRSWQRASRRSAGASPARRAAERASDCDACRGSSRSRSGRGRRRPISTAGRLRKLTVPSSKWAAPGADWYHSRWTKAATIVPPENHGRSSLASASRRAIRQPTPVGQPNIL